MTLASHPPLWVSQGFGGLGPVVLGPVLGPVELPDVGPELGPIVAGEIVGDPVGITFVTGKKKLKIYPK